MTITPDGQHRALFDEDRATLARIEQEAEIASAAFNQFREQQTALGGEVTANDKAELRRRRESLSNELDRYLASEYGVNLRSPAADYEAWRASHQPFHWFVEFYEVMNRGGFDVIIGNPPWKELSSVKDYTVRGYATQRCGNLHGLCTERSSRLTIPGGRFSLIVQLPLVSSSRMASLRDLLRESAEQLYVVPFDDRPGKLFEGLQHCRCVIFMAQSAKSPDVFHLRTSRYQRWYAASRDQLFQGITYSTPGEDCLGLRTFPKHGSDLERGVFARIRTVSDCPLSYLRVAAKTTAFLFYQEATQYWTKVTFGLPYFVKNGVVGAPAHGRYIYFSDSRTAHIVCAILNSSTFYKYFIAYSDCFHLSDGIVNSFPLLQSMVRDKALFQLAKKLMRSLQAEACAKTIHTRNGDTITYAEYYASRSKPIIDEIDKVLAQHYGFTADELDFIIHYDIKYRMGE